MAARAAVSKADGAASDGVRPDGAWRTLLQSAPCAVLIGLILGLASTWRIALAVWRSNRFFDTDDAMHIVQARDWMAGRGWFDLLQSRLGPPPGTVMHWTRVTDVPLAASMKFFSLFGGMDFAERATRILYPILLQLGLYALVLWIARKLLGLRGALAAVMLSAVSVAAVTQFAPGRVNHHNLQILLLLGMVSGTLDALDPARARRAAVAAACAGASLAISLENLPFIGIMSAFFGLVWIARGAEFARALLWFGGFLMVSAAAAFAATVPPWLAFARVCDAYSTGHLAALLGGGAGFIVLALASSRLQSMLVRSTACAFAALLTVGIVALVAPNCLGDPYGAVDPLVHSVWLAHVAQAQPLWKMLAAEPRKALPIAVPLALGTLLAASAAFFEQGARRAQWCCVACFMLMGALGSFWQVLLASYVAALGGLGAGWMLERAFASARRQSPTALVIPFMLLAMTPQSWAAMAGEAKTPTPYGSPDACFRSSAFRPLRRLPPGLTLAPIDAGPYLLAFTRLSALDGPYHRDDAGDRLAIEMFLTHGDQAVALMRREHVRYVAICPAAKELDLYAKSSPRGFIARLREGEAPAGLSLLAVPGTPYRLYGVNESDQTPSHDLVRGFSSP